MRLPAAWWSPSVVTFQLLVLSGICDALRKPLGQSIILISVDGYGAALLNNSKAESLVGFTQIANNGIKTDYLKPTFPALAIPSWHSLATGLYTENHGMMMNAMYDPNSTRTWEGGKGPDDSNYFWWKNRPMPFWYTAGKAGVAINCFWFSYCHQSLGDIAVKVAPERRADLDDPEQTEAMADMFDDMILNITRFQSYRKEVYLIRYAGVDHALKKYGPASDQVEQAIAKFDMNILALQEKMEKKNLFDTTNLIVLSDHGLARVVEEEQYYLEECLSDYSNIVKVVSSKSMLVIHTANDTADAVFFELKVCDQWMHIGDYEEEASSVTIYRSSDLPEKYHYSKGRFLGDIVILTKPGTTVITRQLPSIPAKDEEKMKEQMTDGFDNDAEAMQGIFLARGPAFKVGEKFNHIEIVDIYNVLLNIVGLEAAHPNNGSWERVEPMLQDDWEERASPKTAASSCFTFLTVSAILARLLL